MRIKAEVNYPIKQFDEHELALSQRVFGLVPQSVYFNFNVDIDIDIDKYKIINIYGLSGEGKTIFKDELKKQLNESHYVIDFDDLSDSFLEHKVAELFDLDKDREFLIRLFSTFGMFEMRNIFSYAKELSAGQQKRIKYMQLIYDAYQNRDNVRKPVVMIDEFLTFVDSLSAKVFVQGLRKFMTKMMPDTLLFTFGCNDSIVGYFEHVSITMQNGKITKVTQVEDDLSQ